MNASIPRHRFGSLIAAALLCGMIAAVALTVGAGEAHALFSSAVHCKTIHAVKPFPVSVEVEQTAVELRSTHIGSDQLTVRVIYSDGSSRVLDGDEYELFTSDLAPGFSGDIGNKVTYSEGDHRVSAEFTFAVNAAYGAQYEDTLVFGRGIPAQTYQDKALTNTTWAIEEDDCVPNWDKGTLKSIVDIDTVAPVSITDWFNWSSSIQSIVLDEMDVSRLTTLASAFRNDTALTTLDLTGWNTENVESMNACFTQCTVLPEIRGLSDLNTSKVTNIANLFAKDEALKAVDIKGWDISSVTTMQRAFESCFSLTSVDLAGWDLSSCTSTSLLFYMYPSGRSSLKSVSGLSGWDMSHVTDAGSMFAYCSSLTSVGDLSSWKTPALTICANMFQYCHALTYTGDLGGWNVSHVSSLSNMFQWCSSIASVGDIGRWTTSNVTNMFQTFQGCEKLSANCSSWNVTKVTSHSNFNSGASSVKAPTWKS